MLKFISVFIALCSVLLFPVFAQNINPGEDEIFIEDEVATIRLVLSNEDKTALLADENRGSELFYYCDLTMINSKINATATNVGIRLRGNTSRGHEKRGFKIDFREYGGGKFYSYKKFNLKPNVNDPSVYREPLSLAMYRHMNVPAARTFILKLYINDEYMGIYTNVEQIDDEFLEDRYGHAEGYLYKCSYGANLLDDGQVFNQEMYESEINKMTDTRAEINNFVKKLNNTSDAQFKAVISQVFDVENYIKQLAVEALIGHWDGYSYNQNNYYLFYNDSTQKVTYIPYDADNTWGIDWVDRDWASRDLSNWTRGGIQRPLSTRILNVPEYAALYRYYLAFFIKYYFNSEFLDPILTHAQNMLDESVRTDVFFHQSFGFSYQDFQNSFFDGKYGHVEYGIRDYLNIRTATANEQVALPVILNLDVHERTNIYPNPSHWPVFYISITHDLPILYVYTLTGSSVPYTIKKSHHDQFKISLPDNTKSGVYFIKTGTNTLKWIYQP